MDFFLSMSRRQKRFIQIVFDSIVLLLSFPIAMFLRVGDFHLLTNADAWLAFVLVWPASIATFIFLGTYRSMIRYVAARSLSIMLVGSFISGAMLLVVSHGLDLPVPRTVPVIYTMVSGLLIAGSRFVLRSYFRGSQRSGKAPVIIYGAGDLGRQLLTSVQQGHEYDPIAFIDASPDLVGTEIGGVRVFSPDAILRFIKDQHVKVILIAMSEVSHATQRQLGELLKQHSVIIERIPAVSDILQGKAKISELRRVEIEDLLGREAVPSIRSLIERNTVGKVVLVSGAGGSIGSELCTQILAMKPTTLILLDHSEFLLYSIEMELRSELSGSNPGVSIVPVLGSVCDASLIAEIFSSYSVDAVFHAAAYKHVPLVEANIVEAIKNNVFGTLTLLRGAISGGVSSFTLVSTDKAVRPTNVMGASKRIAELICQAYAGTNPEIIISMVRFGNVLGSSGSVIPLFRKQIEAGGPVTVTHPEITRYFMTIPEAAQLVVQASGMARGGEVFVLDMGEPVRIADLAARIIRLSGLEPFFKEDGVSGVSGLPDRGDVEIRFTSLRPGEKLYEELLIGEDVMRSEHPRIMKAAEGKLSWERLEVLLSELRAGCENRDAHKIKKTLGGHSIEYAAT